MRDRFLAPIAAVLLVVAALVLYSGSLQAAEVVRREIDPKAYAIVKQGRNLGLEVHPPSDGSAKTFLGRYLENPRQWVLYRSSSVAFVPYKSLNSETRREVLLRVYEHDYVDDYGWVHTVVDERETLWSLCEWLTGSGQNYQEVMAHPANRLQSTPLLRGQRVRIPKALLLDGLGKVTAAPQSHDGQLKYGKDREGEYAVYTLKRGETLYTSVVTRFTDINSNTDVLEACNTIAKRSSVRDVADIDAGRKIYIPVHLLSDRYKPRSNPDRREFEATIREAARIRREQESRRDLSGIVVILDAGHGGKDTGADYAASGLYEDEINYDIVCRIRRILERDTGARVYMTLIDKSSGLTPTDAARFKNDTDEYLATNPPYQNDKSSTVSVNLRWMLTNAIYDREVRSGTSPNNIVFTSVHTDALYRKLRGAMVYVPDAKLRRAEEIRRSAVYARYEEGRSHNRFSSVPSELRRDEAMSRNFATVLVHELGKRRIKRHDQGDPIRSRVHRSGKAYVPAVLRNNKVPTKVLVETANINNATDRKNLADDWWREQFAKAYVDALKVYYKTAGDIRTARAD